jgi:hypothetical protein
MRCLVVLLSLGLSGCFHLTGQVVEERRAESTRVKSYQRQVSLPKQTSIELKTEVADGQIRFAATAEKWCRTEHVEVFENKDRITETLPSYHWAVLAGSLLVVAGGAASWAIGADLLPPKYSLKIEEASVEEERDLGHVLVPMGISLSAIGALLLGSHTADAIMLEQRIKPLDKTHRVINHGSGPCSREAASNIAIGLDPMVKGVGSRVTVEADKYGQARVSVLESDLWKLPYAEPFLTVVCAKCRPTTVTLPPRLAARLVLKRARREEMVSWLARHGDSDVADEVRASLEKLKIVVEKKEVTNPSDLLAYAKLSIRKARFDTAREAIEECVTSHPSYKPCRLLELNFTNQRVKKLSKQANSFLRWRKPIKAVIWADKCLQYDSTSKICRSIKERASTRWSRTNMKAKFRIRELTTEGGVAQVQGDFRAPGRYSEMFLAIRLYKGSKELCRDKAILTEVSSRRAISFSGECDVSGRQPDSVKVTIDGYRL